MLNELCIHNKIKLLRLPTKHFIFNLQTPMSSYEKVHNLFKFASDIVECDNLNVTKSNKVEVYFVLVVERRTCTHKIAEIRKVRGYIDVPTQYLYNGQQKHLTIFW